MESSVARQPLYILICLKKTNTDKKVKRKEQQHTCSTCSKNKLVKNMNTNSPK